MPCSALPYPCQKRRRLCNNAVLQASPPYPQPLRPGELQARSLRGARAISPSVAIRLSNLANVLRDLGRDENLKAARAALAPLRRAQRRQGLFQFQ